MPWRLLPFLALSIGLALTAWFVSAATLPVIFQSFAEIGWGVLAIVAVRAIVVAANGIAWATLRAKLCNVTDPHLHPFALDTRSHRRHVARSVCRRKDWSVPEC
jgi:hypothetical protein